MARGKGSFRVNFELKGVQDLRRMMQGMDMRDQMKTLEVVLEDASKPIVAESRNLIDNYKINRTGALRKAMGYVTRAYVNTGKIIAYIGARHISYAGSPSRKTAFPIRQVGPLQSGEEKVVPSKYIHLVHEGFTHVSGKEVKGRPFLKDAFDKHIKQTEWNILSQGAAALEKVWARNHAQFNRPSYRKAA